MNRIDIDDRDDPRIEAFRDIRERDLRGREGLIAEGSVVLDQLLRSPFFEIRSLLVLRNRLAGLTPRLTALPAGVPIHVAGREVFDAVAGFPVHRGVMAYAVRRASPDIDAILTDAAGRDAIVLAACGIANHDNIGAIFRNAAAFGVAAVILDDASCDPLYRKAIRVSVGTALTVPFVRGGTPEAIRRQLAGHGFACLSLSPAGPAALHDIRGRRPRALFVGAEGEGLDAGFLGGGEAVRIAMAPGLDSLNVATSAAIALHHFFSLATEPSPG